MLWTRWSSRMGRVWCLRRATRLASPTALMARTRSRPACRVSSDLCGTGASLFAPGPQQYASGFTYNRTPKTAPRLRRAARVGRSACTTCATPHRFHSAPSETPLRVFDQCTACSTPHKSSVETQVHLRGEGRTGLGLSCVADIVVVSAIKVRINGLGTPNHTPP